MATVNFFGKYRAKVVDVRDPQFRGRIRVMCPKVLGEATSSWCEPCIPVAYDRGGDFALPKLGEFVWVEFEEGNPNKPIYTGGLWSANNSPSPSYEVDTRLITWGDCKISITKDSVDISAPSVTVNGKEIAHSGSSVIVDGKTGYIQ